MRCEVRNYGVINWTAFGSNSKDWLQASGSNRASAAYETAEDASPHACNGWWRTRVTLPACAACKAMPRSCAIPANGPRPAIRTQKPLFLRQRGIPRFPSVGGDAWGDRPVSIRDQRVHSARCRPLHHNRHRCWSGWLDTIQRPPASDAGTLPAELHPACRSPAAVACDAGPLLRRLASPAKPECAVRGVFIPGGKIVTPPAAAQPPPRHRARVSLGRPGAHR